MQNNATSIDATKLQSFLQNTAISLPNVILIYGADEGGVYLSAKDIILHLQQHCGYEADCVDRHDYSKILTESHILNDFFYSASLFNQTKIIVVQECDDNCTQEIITLLEKNLHKKDMTILFLAKDIRKTAKIVKIFENLKKTLIVACYKPDHTAKTMIIRNFFTKQQITHDNSIIDNLASFLPANRMLIEKELEKLLIYSNNQRITIQQIEALFFNYTAELSLEELSYYFCSRQPKAFITSLNSLTDDHPPIMIMRFLQNYLYRLLYVKHLLQNGQSLTQALAQLTPALFFKSRDNFLLLLKKTDIVKMQDLLKSLIQLEIRLKHNIMLNDQMMMQHILSSLVMRS